MPKLTVKENGLHSLAKALEAFDNLHQSKGQDKYALKDAILLSYHGAETLCKSVLFRINPVLVIRSSDKFEKILPKIQDFYAAGNWEFETITLSEALERLHSILGKHNVFESDDYTQLKQASEKLQTYRNNLQHFEFEGDEQKIAYILGSFVPRFLDVLEKIEQKTSRHGQKLLHEMCEIYPKSDSTVRLLRDDYDSLYKDAINGIRSLRLNDASQRIKISYTGLGKRTCETKFEGFISFDADSSVDWFFSHGFPHREQEGDIERYTSRLKILEHSKEDTSVQIFKSSPDDGGMSMKPYNMPSTKHTFQMSLENETAIKNVADHLNFGTNSNWIRFCRQMIVHTRINATISAISWNESSDFFTDIKLLNIEPTIRLTLIPNGVDHQDFEKHLSCSFSPKSWSVKRFDPRFLKDHFLEDEISVEIACDFIADVDFSMTTEKTIIKKC